MAARSKTQYIELKGCRENNLKGIDVALPIGEMICVTGPSGAGKTSLVVNTLYAEGQRRYIESFSTYARQYLERIDKPDVDSAVGLPPAIAVKAGAGRKSSSQSNRVTVGSASEIAEFLRLFFAEAASLRCHSCGAHIVKHTPESVAEHILGLDGRRLMVAFEASWQDVTSRAHVLADLQADGFVRIIFGGKEFHLDGDRDALTELPHSGQVIVVVDRLKGGESSRATESVEEAFQNGLGDLVLLVEPSNQQQPPASAIEIGGRPWIREDFSDRLVCKACDIDFPQSQSRLFSYNSPLGACPTCEGFGNTVDLDPKLVVPDESKSIEEGAIAPWNSPSYAHYLDGLVDVSDAIGLPVDAPFRKLTARQRRTVFEGDEAAGVIGVKQFFGDLQRKKYKMHVRVFLSRWNSYSLCAACDGRRLNQLALSYVAGDQELNYAQLADMPAGNLLDYLRAFPTAASAYLSPLRHTIARLETLCDLGLHYLSLSRPMRTLSTGEAQRVAMSTVLGSSLVNILYVLDEPARGLHSEDVLRLSSAARRIADRGNTVAVVEHHPSLIVEADTVLELGPGAGEAGGEVVFQNKPTKSRAKDSSTLAHAFGVNRNKKNAKSRRSPKSWIRLKGCQRNNLQNIDVDFPIGLLCCVTGVSGSGKSSLVTQTLLPAMQQRLDGKRLNKALLLQSIDVPNQIHSLTLVDQQPIGRSSRSNPATFTKVFDDIRKLFAGTIESKTRNLTPGSFSFNSPMGRCDNCTGEGFLEVDMHFLADVRSTCPVCNGSRFNQQVLEVHYRGKSIADCLQMSASEAIDFFRGERAIQETLGVLERVGLGYLRLGQPAPTLSTGEAQRLKLASHISQNSAAGRLLVLDEPCTGLHPADVNRVLDCLRELVNSGASVILIEHSLQVAAAADYLIDLGPGPAEEGGSIVACGTPEELASQADSVTGRHLADWV